jgi:sulfatase maturation enzyme AslB (radical SAM superfamily)
MRLIDADKLYDALEKYYKSSCAQSHVMARDCLDAVCNAPTIPAVLLEPLARWIVENLDPRCDCDYCFNEDTDFEDRECCNCPKMSEEQVKEALTKWMEEQDAKEEI